MGHVADHPAYVGPQRQFHSPLVVFRVNRYRMAFAGKLEDFLQAVQHIVEIRPFPDGENRGDFLA